MWCKSIAARNWDGGVLRCVCRLTKPVLKRSNLPSLKYNILILTDLVLILFIRTHITEWST
jgi:hypothetical protein